MSFLFQHKKTSNTITVSARQASVSKKTGKPLITFKALGSFPVTTKFEDLPEELQKLAEPIDREIWVSLHSRADEVMKAGAVVTKNKLQDTVNALIGNIDNLSDEDLAKIKEAIKHKK